LEKGGLNLQKEGEPQPEKGGLNLQRFKEGQQPKACSRASLSTTLNLGMDDSGSRLRKQVQVVA